MKISDKTKSTLRTILPLAFGIGVLILIYKDMDFAKVEQMLRSEINYPILLASLLFGLVANLIRGLRWQLLVVPIVPEIEKPRPLNSILTVLGSYAVNMGIPRAGELWRCIEMKRYEQLPFSSLFGTLITDRLVDIFSLLLILVGIFAIEQDFLWFFLDQHPRIQQHLTELISTWWIYPLALAGIAAFLLALGYVRRNKEGRIAQTLWGIARGVRSIYTMEHRGRFLLYTILIWLCYFGFFYTTFFAFSFTRELSLGAGLVAFAMSSASVVAPVQGGIGAWHFMVITSLVAYGVGRSDAEAFALVVHTSQTLWITLVGLIAILALPMVNKRYHRLPTDPSTPPTSTLAA